MAVKHNICLSWPRKCYKRTEVRYTKQLDRQQFHILYFFLCDLFDIVAHGSFRRIPCSNKQPGLVQTDRKVFMVKAEESVVGLFLLSFWICLAGRLLLHGLIPHIMLSLKYSLYLLSPTVRFSRLITLLYRGLQNAIFCIDFQYLLCYRMTTIHSTRNRHIHCCRNVLHTQ